jgi:hypothetical protein
LATTKISKDGGAVGAGEHWNAQPIFQVPPAMVKAGLVQLPDCWTSGTRTDAGANTAVVVGLLDAVVPAAVVDVEAPAAVVEVADPATVDVGEDELVPPADLLAAAALVVDEADEGGGSLYPPAEAPEEEEALVAEPVAPLNAMPSTRAIRAIRSICQVFHDRRSLMPSSPGSGRCPGDRRGSIGPPATGTDPMVGGDAPPAAGDPDH